MPTADVFDQNTPPLETTPPIVTDTASPFNDKLKEIVNDQGQPKYKDVPSALEALKASQAHIKRLEDEAKTRSADEIILREELKQKEVLEEVVRRLQTNKDPAKEVTPPIASLSEDTIAKTVENILVRKEAVTKAEQNVTNVTNVLVSKFGDKTKEAVATKAAELGMTPQALGALSSTNPQLVLSLFGEKPLTIQPTISSNTTPLTNPPVSVELKRPEKSLLVGPGATDKNRTEMMKAIREKVYKQHGVET